MFRTVHRLFTPSLRSSARVNVHVATHSSRAALIRRMMSSESHSGHGSTQNDRPWIIGSALVFGPLFLYLVSPSARKGTHTHTDHAHHSHHGEQEEAHQQHVEPKREEHIEPIADDEGTTLSGQEVKESMQKAFESDSPKDAQGREEAVAKAETTPAVEVLTPEVHPQEESPDAKLISESETTATSAAPIGADDVAREEKVQNTASNANEPAAESKA